MAPSSEQQSGDAGNGSDQQREETLYDKYQKSLAPSSDEKSSKGKFFIDNPFKSGGGDSGSNNKSQQKDQPAAFNGNANRAQNNSSDGGSSSRRQRFPKNYDYPSAVHGFQRDEMSLEIMLVGDGKDDSFKSIGVVGPPGVGKTTLCKLILKNERVKGSYERMIWVELDKPMTKEGENKETEQSGATEEDVDHIFGEGEFAELLKDLNEQVKEKKCLIVIDDVVEGEGCSCYENLKTCFSHDSDESPRKKGGTIIVISRSEEAAKKVMVGEKLLFHRLMPLSELRSCWAIYKDAVEGYAREDHDASKDVMEELMKKCGGLPGAARMLGKIKARKLKEKNSGA